MTDKDKLQKIVSDPYLFIKNFMYVVDKKGKTVQFVPNKQQKYLLQNLDKFNVVLKSRQLGITTLSCAYSIYLALTNSNITCLLMGHSIEGANGIFDKLKQLYFALPSCISIPTIANNKKELKFINGSRIVVLSCGKKESVRGLTLRFVHISEAGSCSDSLEDQILAIEQCLTPNGQMIIESTAKGFNFFSEIYFKADRQESLYKAFFFSWIDDKVMFVEEYKEYAERYIALHGSLPTVEEFDDKELTLFNKGATIEQIVWRRFKIANSGENRFAQEFPSTPTEAFITTGSNVFDTQKIQERINNINGNVKLLPMPDALPKILKPWFNRGFDIWETPKCNTKYYVGVDSAEGLGGDSDYSVIEVVNEEGYQMAEFVSNKIKAYEFTDVVEAVGTYYNRAFLVVEKASAGQTVCDRLWHDKKYMNVYKHRNWDARGNTKRKVGFETTRNTKQQIINYFVEMFDKDELCINSERLLREMKMFVYKDGSSEATKGNHDDTVMAMAMALHGKKEGHYYI